MGEKFLSRKIIQDCGYQINADVNGAKNILRRAVGYMLMAGAVVTQPEGERFVLNHTPQPRASGGCPPMEGGGHWHEDKMGFVDTIIAERLTKCFNGLKAVDSVTFRIKSGEIFGLLGPNGAGKTTLLKMLATLLKPTAGVARVCGYDVVGEADEVRRRIGIVFQEPTLDNKLTAFENLDFHARMYGMDKETRRRRIKDVLKLVGLEGKVNVLVENFSGGMQRRLEIARGLLHSPEVLFLDEPTLGLDVQTRRGIWEHIKRRNEEEDVTIVVTTHYMEEAEFLCDRIAIIDSGKIIAADTPEKLKNSYGSASLSITVASQSDAERLAARLSAFGFVEGVSVRNNVVDVRGGGEASVPRLVLAAFEAGVEVKALNFRESTLEDAFLRLTGREIRDEEGSFNDFIRRAHVLWHRRR